MRGVESVSKDAITKREGYHTAYGAHSTATHLLESGVDISVIALWLGHERLETTHIYVEANLEMKKRALDKLTPAGSDMPRFKVSDKVLAFLKSL